MIYILDTNVLLYDPTALTKFEEHDLVVPMVVIEEIDTFKKDQSEIGFAAREVSRQLDKLRKLGSLKEGVPLPGGGTLRIAFTGEMDVSSNDNNIIRVAQKLNLQKEVILVSRDTNMRIKGDAIGVKSEDYQNARIRVDNDGAYTGLTEIKTCQADIDDLYTNKAILNTYPNLYQNQFVLLKNGDQSGMAQLEGDTLHLLPQATDVWGIRPRNKEQRFALQLLMDPNINLVTLSGVAGSGKTLLALCAGMALTTDEHLYTKILVSRPIFPMGKDLGYLPGTIDEKLNPWTKPIYDNLELMLGRDDPKKNKSKRSAGPKYQYLLDTGVLEVEPLTYIRGRSIPDQYMIVDECQNLSPHEIKTILTRAGDGTKIVLTGDPNQIDNAYVDRESNGLSYVIERFKGQAMAGHVSLTKGERSPLATLAAKLL